MADKTPSLIITDLKAVKQRLDAHVEELPGFDDTEPLRARLRRLSLLEMAESGDIPNELLGAVSDLYYKGAPAMKDIKDTAKSFHFIADKALVDPTYQQIRDAGLTLTDAQLLQIYLYAVGGVRSLRPFRTGGELPDSVPNG